MVAHVYGANFRRARGVPEHRVRGRQSLKEILRFAQACPAGTFADRAGAMGAGFSMIAEAIWGRLAEQTGGCTSWLAGPTRPEPLLEMHLQLQRVAGTGEDGDIIDSPPAQETPAGEATAHQTELATGTDDRVQAAQESLDRPRVDKGQSGEIGNEVVRIRTSNRPPLIDHSRGQIVVRQAVERNDQGVG